MVRVELLCHGEHGHTYFTLSTFMTLDPHSLGAGGQVLSELFVTHESWILNPIMARCSLVYRTYNLKTKSDLCTMWQQLDGTWPAFFSPQETLVCVGNETLLAIGVRNTGPCFW